MNKIKLTILCVIGLSLVYSCKRDVFGCTDSSAANYSTEATKDDGSCFYKSGGSTIISLNGTTNSGNWQGDGDEYCTTFSVNALTQNIIDNGAILVYAEAEGSILQLPFSFTQGTWSTHVFYTAQVGLLEICYQDDDGLTPNPGSWNFKVVIISPSDMLIINDVDLNSYSEVKSALEF